MSVSAALSIPHTLSKLPYQSPRDLIDEQQNSGDKLCHPGQKGDGREPRQPRQPHDRMATMRRSSESSQARRRQFRSCDQCRKGKRACDIVISDESLSLIQQNGATVSAIASCSNCTKTRKECTLDWLNSKATSKRSKHREDSGQKPRQDRILLPKSQEVGQAEQLSCVENCCSMPPSAESSFDDTRNEIASLSPFTEFSWTDLASIQAPLLPPPPELSNNYSAGSVEDKGPFFQDQSTLSMGSNVQNYNIDSFNELHGTSNQSDGPHTQKYSFVNRQKQRNKRRPSPAISSTSSSTMGIPAKKTRRRFSAVHKSGLFLNNPSSDTLEHQLATSVNRGFISSNLMKIYHDSVEHALTCWLTDVTCPYTSETPVKVPSARPTNPIMGEWGPSWSNRMLQRVCSLDKAASHIRSRQITAAEEKAVSLVLKKTIMAFAAQWAQSSERSAANFVSPNSRSVHVPEMRTSTPQSVNSMAPSDEDSNRLEFDRTLQEKFWHDARQSLHETSHIESFRLVLANIIFSLVQRPLGIKERLQIRMPRRLLSSHQSFDRDPLWDSLNMNLPTPESLQSDSQFTPSGSMRGVNFDEVIDRFEELNQVVSLEGPPVFLESALRQVFSFRHKVENCSTQEAGDVDVETDIRNDFRAGEHRNSTEKGPGRLSGEDKKTFHMLFWLGVMFDTLSAAMTQRPLVVSDEDSEVLPQETPRSNKNKTMRTTQINLDYFEPGSPPSTLSSVNAPSNLWDNFLLEKQRPRRSNRIIRWPCTYEIAASVLCDAAPIKVLLFRKVTRLQTLMARRVRQEKLEKGIDEALQINEYWYTHFGPFFHDCIKNHDTLPARIQSWYVVLAGHWHLAGLLLADTIEEIDKNNSLREEESDSENNASCSQQKKNKKQIISNLRLQHAYSVSDLGRCASPNDESSFSRAKEFHFAVNKGALLTEPWTEVLIRSFSKAGSVLLDLLSPSLLLSSANPKHLGSGSGSVEDGIENTRIRCENCIEALWHIGKKSDMALLASSVLSNALEERLEYIRKVTNHSNLSAAAGAGFETTNTFEIPPCDITSSSAVMNDFPPDFIAAGAGAGVGFWGEDQFLWDGIPT